MGPTISQERHRPLVNTAVLRPWLVALLWLIVQRAMMVEMTQGLVDGWSYVMPQSLLLGAWEYAKQQAWGVISDEAGKFLLLGLGSRV